MSKRSLAILASCIGLIVWGGVSLKAQSYTIVDDSPTYPDPPLFIGSPSCPNSGCGTFYSGHAFAIPGNALTIYDQGKSGDDNTVGGDSPLLLVLGVVNQTGGSAPTIASVTDGNGDATGTPVVTETNVFQGAWSATNGYAGQLNPPASDSAYAVTGAINSGSPSEEFGNWQYVDLNGPGLGINASTYAIFVYDIAGVTLQQGGYLDIALSGNLPLGSYAIGYGCQSGSDPNGSNACNPTGDVFSTPFTHAGIVAATTVSEPGTLLLLSLGLLPLIFVLFRRHTFAT